MKPLRKKEGACCLPCTILYFYSAVRTALGGGRADPVASCISAFLAGVGGGGFQRIAEVFAEGFEGFR